MASSSRKHLAFEEAPAVFARLRASGRTIVQCHGTFDLIHPGHIIHLEQAKELGDILVVTVTGEGHVNKGPGRPYFNDALRVKSLAALEMVDYVVVVPFPAAVEAIACVQPHVYCKGKEYEDPSVDPTGNIHDDIREVERLGGRVVYIGDVVFSSTRLLNDNFDTYPPDVKEFCLSLAHSFGPDDFRSVVESFASLRVLVVGDIIFDRYTTVTTQGLTSKDHILSGRFLHDDTQPGGALAVFRHVRQFTPHAKLLGLVGREPWVEQALAPHIGAEDDEIIRAPGFTTVVKQRFVEPQAPGKELIKLFAVNYIDAKHPEGHIPDSICSRLGRIIRDFDLVMMMDFGHGVGGEAVRTLVQERSRFLAVNCQTNSNNYGYNVLNRQYRRADSFSLDKRELSLACGKKDMDFCQELALLAAQLGAKYAWLTRGEVETIGLRAGAPPCFCPCLERVVVDTIGAGDAFCALASMAAAKGHPIELATFLGQLAGAQAVRIVGNSECVDKAKLLKSGMAMLSFQKLRGRRERQPHAERHQRP